VAFLK